ncbi:Tad domain-containing protein [Sphingomonas sp. RB56-2]|uniref:Tad domain-containing protein n=1 Tax=Sphingomonas brevis TaxID=2908206 RepID=A0ABT0S8A2_9SPHN|nr:Tad domain-containing protein [Sphingomonas brevis]MCL6740636.1 Tad domain-containing protein [Sphingomonas brevis]
MLKAFNKLWNNERGNMVVIAAAALPMLVGSAGLATDTIQWALWKRQLQRAADSAAIAGVYDRFGHDGATTNTATAVDHDLTLNQHTNMGLESGYPVVTFPANAGSNRNQVRVVLAVQKELSFSSMFLPAAPVIKATAQAAGVSTSGDFCVLSLQHNGKTGIQATGNASIVMDCGMMTNSTATNAAAGQGSSSVTATTIAASGGIQQSSNWTVDSYQPYSPQLDDPYENLDPSDADHDFDSCPANPPSLTINNGNTGQTIPADKCYSSISVQSNRSVTFSNVNGGDKVIVTGGGVNVQGTLHLNGVALIITNRSTSSSATIGTLDMNSSGQIDSTAPTSGKWAGMAIYQDRRAVDNSPTGTISANSPNKINGNSTNKIRGVVYFPNQQITYNGTGTGTATCTQFVAKRIYWSGNSGVNNFTKNCPGSGIQAINAPLKVRLVA